MTHILLSLLWTRRVTIQGAATEVAGVLRKGGVSVDLVLEARKTKANFKHASRVGASHAVMVAPTEWQEGKVRA